ncbi:MAG: hypothetical protein EOP58_15000 [Sphingomonadales bacterium]|jgi:hypothetical protein|nr:MAG: hypothetical protein EOP58_15000 [Sphingomonadales bacterium]
MTRASSGSGLLVKSALVHLLILIAMLFAGIAVPVAAHGHGAITVAAVGHGDAHSAADIGDHDHRPDNDREDDAQDGIAPHHHCPAGMTALAPVMTDRTSGCRVALYVLPTARLNSRALEPLTEPPAA